MKKKFTISREAAMSACPVRRPALKIEEKNGKLYVTVEFERPRWQRVLGGERLCRRTFGLDAFGQEVYDGCDGSTPVSGIIKRFSERHHLSLAEAEISVSTFLKTLVSKGLAGIPVSKEALREMKK